LTTSQQTTKYLDYLIKITYPCKHRSDLNKDHISLYLLRENHVYRCFVSYLWRKNFE